jgi:prepilin peptidase CpaA
MDIVQGCAVSAVSVAAVIDLRSRRIPNWVTASTLLLAIVINVWLHGFGGLAVVFFGAALGLAFLLPFYAVHAIGAGDVKLLAALGALLGPQILVSVAIYAAIAGGAISAVILLHQRRLFITLHEILVLHRAPTRSGAKAPYGVAIASGVFLSLMLPSVLG